MHKKDYLIGQQLGNYRIERLLGRGGMASVYYGIDLQLERPAAVKVIDERNSGSTVYAERFVREARAMASWRHPNIPQIYQAGLQNGFYFYAMEYIDGLDLEMALHRLTQKGELLSFEDVILIIQAVAAALDYAHQKGAIHRDVKPSNVLISEDDRILLTDFGLVLEVERGTYGEVFGSPHYIAPEQARSSSLAVPQSDLYSLGVILYEMLVGRLPFNDASPASLALQHINLEPPAPREINPDLSPKIETILLKALSKQPQERYQTGKALMEALYQAMQLPSIPEKLTHPWDLPPATLAVLHKESDKQPPSTLTRLEAIDQDDIPVQVSSDVVERSPVSEKNLSRIIPGSILLIVPILIASLLSILCLGLTLPRWIANALSPDPGTANLILTSTATLPTTDDSPQSAVATATFPVSTPELNVVILTINPTTGGTITATPAGPYHYSDVVTLEAVADPDYTFTGWSGDLSGTTNPVTLTLEGDKTVGAIWNEYFVLLPVILTASADAWIDQNSATNNFGADAILKIRSQGPADNFRALVRFDLPANIPEGYMLHSATFRLYAPAWTDGRTLEALRIIDPWLESDVNWMNQPRTKGTAATTSSGSGNIEWDVTALVLTMYSEGNNGFLIRDASENATSYEQQFHSREKGESIPELVITFAPAQASTEVEYQLLIATQKGDSFFLINQSNIDFPLENIYFDNEKTQMSGEDWEVEMLEPRECVTVWKEEGRDPKEIKAPKGVDCEIVGELLRLAGPDKFWESAYRIDFEDVLVGVCLKDEELCELTFDSSP